MNTESNAWGERFYDRFHQNKFLLISLMHVTRRSNQLTYSLYFSLRYHDSSGIKLYIVIKIEQKTLSKQRPSLKH